MYNDQKTSLCNMYSCAPWRLVSKRTNENDVSVDVVIWSQNLSKVTWSYSVSVKPGQKRKCYITMNCYTYFCVTKIPKYHQCLSERYTLWEHERSTHNKNDGPIEVGVTEHDDEMLVGLFVGDRFDGVLRRLERVIAADTELRVCVQRLRTSDNPHSQLHSCRVIFKSSTCKK